MVDREVLQEIAAILEWLKFDAGPKGHGIYETYERQVLIPALMRLRATVRIGQIGGPALPLPVMKAIAATNTKLAESKSKQPRPVRRLFY